MIREAICKLASNDAFWGTTPLRKLATHKGKPSSGISSDALMAAPMAALIGAGGAAGIGGLTGKLDMKQTLLLALLGGGLGGGGMAAWNALNADEATDKATGGEKTNDFDSAASYGIAGGAVGGLAGAAVNPADALLKTFTNRPAALQDVVKAKNPAAARQALRAHLADVLPDVTLDERQLDMGAANIRRYAQESLDPLNKNLKPNKANRNFGKRMARQFRSDGGIRFSGAQIPLDGKVPLTDSVQADHAARTARITKMQNSIEAGRRLASRGKGPYFRNARREQRDQDAVDRSRKSLMAEQATYGDKSAKRVATSDADFSNDQYRNIRSGRMRAPDILDKSKMKSTNIFDTLSGYHKQFSMPGAPTMRRFGGNIKLRGILKGLGIGAGVGAGLGLGAYSTGLFGK